MNDLLPIFLKLKDKPCLVVGAGKVAVQKVQQLIDSRARVTVIAPEIGKQMIQLAKKEAVCIKRRRYKTGDVNQFIVVIGATNDQKVNQTIYKESVLQNIPVNIVDQPNLCTFYMGASYQQGNLKIAVSTNGKSPTIGKSVRDEIKSNFGIEYSNLLEDLGKKRKQVIQNNTDQNKRSAILKNSALSEFQQIQQNDSNGNLNGKVTLVGAGPGDPELISIKGLKAIQTADVIFYDSLVNPAILKDAPKSTQLIHVGKVGKHKCRQTDINKSLINFARAGNSVVRLKNGDPFVFGRGGEEIQILTDAKIPFEVVPGISSGIGVPGHINMPLTQRDISSTVVFVTGHECHTKNKTVDWKSIAKTTGTIVVFMGVKSLPKIAKSLIQNGLKEKTPAAIIQNGTLQSEKILTGTIFDLGKKVIDNEIEPPAIIVIGEVVSLYKNIQDRHLSKIPRIPIQHGKCTT